MNFEVILHGKPNAGCHRATSGLDEVFCQNLVDKFFQSMDSIKDTETFIVDVRYWKGMWYSIYTLWIGGNISDTADRTSFLAISIVVSKQYFCLVSDVYKKLTDACRKSVIGNYISNKGKYLVSDFSDNSKFENLITSINSDFVNLSENLDDSFKQTTDNGSTKHYSLLDCDSKAFVEDLKKHGRIIISRSYESKDERLTNTDKYQRELQAAKLDLEARLLKINSLTNQIKDLESQLTSKNSKTKDTIAEQKKQIESLNQEKANQENKISELTKTITSYEENAKQIAKLIGLQQIEKPELCQQNGQSKLKFNIKNILLIVNTILLLLLLFASGLKSCDSQIQNITGGTRSVTHEKLQEKINELQAILVKKEKQITALQSSTGGYDYNDDSFGNDDLANNKDVDCELTYYQNNKPVDPSNIDVNTRLTIIVAKPMDGYDFHVHNISAIIKSGEAFDLKKQNSKLPITITYRSKNISNCNIANKLVIQ